LCSLRRIVLSAHSDWLRDAEGDQAAQEQSFARAFWAVGHLFRRAEPRRDRYFQSWVSVANELLKASGMTPIDGRDMMAACLGHGDICWRRQDPSVGSLLEIGVDESLGGDCRNSWRDLLAGRPTLAPVTPPADRCHPSELAATPRFFEERDGRMIRVG
jgi:hypothetical protein